MDYSGAGSGDESISWKDTESNTSTLPESTDEEDSRERDERQRYFKSMYYHSTTMYIDFVKAKTSASACIIASNVSRVLTLIASTKDIRNLDFYLWVSKFSFTVCNVQ
jgi:hypothetical protein